jgi:hypothetical protein
VTLIYLAQRDPEEVSPVETETLLLQAKTLLLQAEQMQQDMRDRVGLVFTRENLEWLDNNTSR